MTSQILIGETLVTATRLVMDRAGEIFRVGLVLVLGFFAILIFLFNFALPLFIEPIVQVGGAAAGQPMPNPRLLPAMLLVVVAEFLFISVFAVGWHRLILLGLRAGGGLGVSFGRREIAYLGRLWLCFMGLFLASIVFSLLEYRLAGLMQANPQGFVLIAMVGFSVLAFYILGRVGLGFAALSIDQPMSFADSWRATRGHGGRILVIYGVVSAGWVALGFLLSSLAGPLGLGEVAPYATLFINAVLATLFIALLVTINAILYRRLSGWRPS